MLTRSSDRRFRAALFAVLIAIGSGDAAQAADMHKVLRISSSDITSLDPQQGTDLYSTRVTSAIFEALYEFEYLSTGSKVVPNTARGDAGHHRWRQDVDDASEKGILFADDPVFKGKPRELAAADYVYSIKRSIDPNLRGGGDPALTDLIVGARAGRRRRAQARREVRLRRADRGTARDRSLHARRSTRRRPTTRCSSASPGCR